MIDLVLEAVDDGESSPMKDTDIVTDNSLVSKQGEIKKRIFVKERIDFSFKSKSSRTKTIVGGV